VRPLVHHQPRSLDLGPCRPEEIAARLHHLPGFVFLDSSSRDFTTATGQPTEPSPDTFSFITARPTTVTRGHVSDLSPLRSQLEAFGYHPEIDCGFPTGGAFGHLSFDGRFCFGIYDHLLAYHHASGEWFEVGNLSRELDRPPQPSAAIPASPLNFEFEMPRQSFIEAVQRAKDYISAGDVYQVNLSHRASAPWPHGADPFLLYRHLRDISPAPFSAYLNLDNNTILSSSPELFLRMSGNLIRTRPIKGTRPRHHDAAIDEKSAYDLLTSPKEIAELIMITDLERNDLGQVCEFGSVRAAELLKLERFAQVFHLVSTIEGTLRPGIDHLAALAACSPGGSISGAPKKRALEIIRELEPRPRHLYTGAIGYIGANGESQFNIAIRTAIVEADHHAHFHVGAGIVADSDPQREYQETLDKAAGILRAAQAWNAANARST
jgi:para-aminobenzoate synthetase component 1